MSDNTGKPYLLGLSTFRILKGRVVCHPLGTPKCECDLGKWFQRGLLPATYLYICLYTMEVYIEYLDIYIQIKTWKTYRNFWQLLLPSLCEIFNAVMIPEWPQFLPKAHSDHTTPAEPRSVKKVPLPDLFVSGFCLGIEEELMLIWKCF